MSDADRAGSEKRSSEPAMIETNPNPTRAPERVESSDARRQPLKPAVLLPARTAKKGGLQRAIGIVRKVAPVVQKVLPLLEGNVVSAVSNILAPRPEAPRVNLEPIESAVAKMRKEHLDLRLTVTDQTATLKRITTQVEKLQDAAERNAEIQNRILQDLQGQRTRVNIVAWTGLGLLAISILLNILLFSRVQQLAH